MSSGDTFTLDSWGLDITPVPEPATLAAALLVIATLAWRERRRLRIAVTRCVKAFDRRTA